MEREVLIQAEKLSKKYDGTYVLKDIDLTVKKGDFILIEGRSGAGKTTLLNILGCMDRPTQGTLYIDGKDTSKMTQRQLADLRLHKIGFIFQEHNLIDNLTVEENIMLPMKIARRRDAKHRARQLMENFGITYIAHKKPDAISGGEKQRAAIARAMANEPDILLADEPTASLDMANSDSVIGAFQKANQEYDATVIIASHDVFTRNRISFIYSLEDKFLVKK